MKNLSILLLIFAGCWIVGCDKLDSKYKSEKTITLTIASVKPVAGDYDWLQGVPVYIYKQDGSPWQLWHSHDPIKGFDGIYEPGYESVIKVRRLTLADPPQDAGAYEYELKRVVSKTKKDSEDIPGSYLVQ